MSATALVFCGGPPSLPPDIHEVAELADLIICADGGAVSCSALSVVPDYLVGDCDSIPEGLLGEYQESGVVIKRYPRRKDATDLELALDLAVVLGADRVLLVNSLGGRWDMSFANILLTASSRYRGMSMTHLGADCVLRPLHPGICIVRGRQGRVVSLLPLTPSVENVTLKGFEYSLSGATLVFGSTRGVSNVIKEERASIEHDEGTLLFIEKR